MPRTRNHLSLLPKPNATENRISSSTMSESRAQKSTQSMQDPLALVSTGASALTVFLIFLVGAAGTLAFLSSQTADPLVLTLMGVLATLGVFFIFGLAAGHIRVSERTQAMDLAAALSERLETGCLLTTQDARILHANRSAYRLMGRDELGDLTTLEEALAGTQAGAEVLFRLARAAQRGRYLSEDVLVPGRGPGGPANDEPRWLRVAVKPFGNVDLPEYAGRAVLWTLTDITYERHQSEAHRQALESELAAFAGMPAGLLIVDTSGRIQFANATLMRWLGHSDAQAVRPTNLGEVVSRADHDLLTSLATGRLTAPSRVEIDFVTADGALWPATCLAAARSGEDGGVETLSLVVTAREVDDDHLAALVNGQSELATLFRNAPFGIALIDQEGRMSSANPVFDRLMCRSKNPDSNTAEHVYGLEIDATGQEALTRALNSAAKGKAALPAIEVAVGKDGEFARRVYIESLGKQAGSKRAPAVIYVTDATEERALGIKFAQSQKMEAVGKLAGGIAHDFNNVLTAIIGFSDLLLASHRPGDHAYNNIPSIRSSANHAAGLVKQLLAFSRRQTLEPEVLQLNELVTDLSVILNRLLGENVELKISSGRELWQVKADRNQLNQVVINLAVNARDAMPDGGRLTVKMRNVTERESQRMSEHGMIVGQYVLIEVEDTGVGMAPEVVAKIFEPFFTTKDVGKGTGLGLSTVYGIIKQTGGYIYADSKPGSGTMFRVYLPRHVAPEGTEEEAPKSTKKERPLDLTGHGRVLVVEDEDAVRIFATEALRRQGYEVLQACDGLEALDIMEENDHQVDLVVSDVKMPEMDGPTLFNELRSHNPDLKFIFVSGYADDAFTKTLDPNAEFTFLPKPYTLAQIAEVVKDQLR